MKSFPRGTSNETSWAALTLPPRSVAYSVNRALYSQHVDLTSGLCNSEPPGRKLRQHDQAEQRDDQHDPERGKLHVLTILP